MHYYIKDPSQTLIHVILRLTKANNTFQSEAADTAPYEQVSVVK